METPEKVDLQVFYAVTMTSVYRVVGHGEDAPYLEKIALRDSSSTVGISTKVSNGTMVSIGENLNLFVPEGSGRTSPMSTVEREIARVNTSYWGGHTSKVVALFLDGAEALACNAQEELIANDSRWRAQTIEVLRAIGDNHMYFSITAWNNLWLLPPSEWWQPPPE
jgi:hypothetical protein